MTKLNLRPGPLDYGWLLACSFTRCTYILPWWTHITQTSHSQRMTSFPAPVPAALCRCLCRCRFLFLRLRLCLRLRLRLSRTSCSSCIQLIVHRYLLIITDRLWWLVAGEGLTGEGGTPSRIWTHGLRAGEAICQYITYVNIPLGHTNLGRRKTKVTKPDLPKG